MRARAARKSSRQSTRLFLRALHDAVRVRYPFCMSNGDFSHRESRRYQRITYSHSLRTFCPRSKPISNWAIKCCPAMRQGSYRDKSSFRLQSHPGEFDQALCRCIIQMMEDASCDDEIELRHRSEITGCQQFASEAASRAVFLLSVCYISFADIEAPISTGGDSRMAQGPQPMSSTLMFSAGRTNSSIKPAQALAPPIKD